MMFQWLHVIIIKLMRRGVIEMSCDFFIVDFSYKMYVEIDHDQFC